VHILLDDQPCQVKASSVGEAIDGVAGLARQRGRVVVEVRVDGQVWTEEDLQSTDARAGEAAEIHCVTADLRELVCQTLAQAAETLAEAGELQQAAAEAIQAGRQADGMSRLGEALGIWLSVHEAVVKSSHAAGLDPGSIPTGQGTLQDCIERLNTQLRALRASLETKDTVSLADALLYELPQTVSDWREALLAMETQIRGELS